MREFVRSDNVARAPAAPGKRGITMKTALFIVISIIVFDDVVAALGFGRGVSLLISLVGLIFIHESGAK